MILAFLYYLYISFILSACLFCAAKEVSPIFKWFDVWIRFFWDAKKKWLYFLPLPCVGFIFKFCVLIFIFTSCVRASPQGQVIPKDRYEIKVIDGCEYIEIVVPGTNGFSYSLTHKGNCSNSTHCTK